jgi:hypothetical protein
MDKLTVLHNKSSCYAGAFIMSGASGNIIFEKLL